MKVDTHRVSTIRETINNYLDKRLTCYYRSGQNFHKVGSSEKGRRKNLFEQWFSVTNKIFTTVILIAYKTNGFWLMIFEVFPNYRPVKRNVFQFFSI